MSDRLHPPAEQPVPSAARPTGPNGPVAPPPTPMQQELEVLICARYPLLYVVSWEEERVEQQLAEIARARNKRFLVWTCTQGIIK